jgi:hypothetical protein
MQLSIPKVLRLLGIAFVISVVGLVLTACDNDDDATPSPAFSNNPPATESSVETPQLQVGDAAPAFSLPTSDGGTVSLADYVGEQPVLLYFHMAVG